MRFIKKIAKIDNNIFLHQRIWTVLINVQSCNNPVVVAMPTVLINLKKVVTWLCFHSWRTLKIVTLHRLVVKRQILKMLNSTSIVGTDIRMSNLDIRLSNLDIRMSSLDIRMLFQILNTPYR